jgi:hypothetical protein
MADVKMLDKAYHYVMDQFVQTGQAPHYTELAAGLGIPMEEGRQLVHDLVSQLPAWVHPGTDLIASIAPFNNLPTQYRVSVDGQQKWYGQ